MLGQAGKSTAALINKNQYIQIQLNNIIAA